LLRSSSSENYMLKRLRMVCWIFHFCSLCCFYKLFFLTHSLSHSLSLSHSVLLLCFIFLFHACAFFNVLFLPLFRHWKSRSCFFIFYFYFVHSLSSTAAVIRYLLRLFSFFFLSFSMKVKKHVGLL
jgi:hypothetical protein